MHDQPAAAATSAVAREPWWRRWRTILFGAFLLLTALNAVDEGADAARGYRQAADAALARHVDTAEALAGSIRLLFASYQATAETAGQAIFGARLPAAQYPALLAAIRRTHPELNGASIVSPSGRIIAADPARGTGLDVSDRPYYQPIVRGAGAIVTDLLTGRLARVPIIAVAVPHRDPGGRLLGMIVLELSPGAVAQAVNIGLGERAYPVVVDRVGRAVWHGEARSLDWSQRDFSGLTVVQDALGGRTGRATGFGDPISGEPRLGAAVPIAPLGWAVGVFQPVDVALAPAWQELGLALTATSALLLAGLLLAFVLSGWLSAPVRGLSAGVAAVARGDLQHRVEVRGPTELSALATDFNRMAAELERARRQEQELNEELAAANEELQVNAAQMEENVSELEAANEQLDLAVAEANRAVRARDVFLARASHELRTPLTSALGTVRLMKQALEGRLRESPEALIEIAGRNLDSMLRLINELLDASKLGAGEERLALEAVEVAAVLSRAVEVVQPQAHLAGVRIDTAVEAGLTIMADPLKMEQVLVNLLANAVKFTPSGGLVLVEARGDEGRPVLRVRDTGKGIPTEHLERVFEPFFQVEPRRRPAGGQGSGLGLAIVRAIVELHGGTVHAESDGPGRGSVFVVSLPRT